MNRIFISYSHHDEAWKDRLVSHFSTLQKYGLLEVWDDRQIEGGADWLQEIEKAAKSAIMAILLISENFFNSTFIREHEIPWLLERQEKGLVRILPLILKPCSWNQVVWLQPILAKPKDGSPLSISTPDQIDADLRAFARETAELLSRDIPKASPQVTQSVPPDKIYLSRLPTSGGELFGREQETAILCNAWADPHTNILTLVEWGGVGKTALVNEWLSGIAKDNYRGAERVYGWSFYSQGAREEKQVSADEFLAHALAWFGDQASQAKSPWDKGVRVAELLRQQKTLLILDGVEPLQYPSGPMHGLLKDQGLQALLKELAYFNPGLCVVTTRVALTDLSNKEKISAKRIDLENLSPEAGVRLLKSLGVKGTEAELRPAIAEFEGHALALKLLGSYLAVVHDGEIRKRDLIPQLTEEEEHGGHARRVMESYERWLTDTPELGILYLMGLFDRPATKGAIDVLLAPPPIEGLTSHLQLVNLQPAKLQYALNRLRDLHLFAEKDEHRPDTLDCHPLVREYFGEKFRQHDPSAWEKAHNRLYEYYKSLPAKYLPDTLEEMEPLFAAVLHGCFSGKHQEAIDEICWPRIKRGSDYFSTKILGAYGAELATLSNFFENPWSKPIKQLRNEDKALILNWAGTCLRSIGRLSEASKPLMLSMEMHIAQKNWYNAATEASNLIEIYLAQGMVQQAVYTARKSVDFAERVGMWAVKMMFYTTLADTLHQSGELNEAKKLFYHAEAMQHQNDPEHHRYLYSLWGYRFCDLLLSYRKVNLVLRRASETLLNRRESWYSLLAVALDLLSLGRAHFLKAYTRNCNLFMKLLSSILGASKIIYSLMIRKDIEKSFDYLSQAITGLREAGHLDYLPRGLLARAALYRVQENFAAAWDDLSEAEEIAERGEMGLHRADFHLEACRLCMAQKKAKGKKKKENDKLQEAKEHLDIAAEMIETMGYGRRKPEIEVLRRELAL